MNITTTRRLLTLTVSTLAAFGALGVDLRSYATVGHTWGTNQVVYYVNPQNIYVSDAAATSAIQTAAAAWHDQSQANVQLVYGGATNGSSLTLNNKNEVFFRNDSNGYVAETYWWYDGTGKLVDGDIVFHESYAFSAGSGCANGVYIEDVAIHEFGHVLGLAHSGTAGATMSAAMPGYCDMSQLSLEADDISGIESLYPPSSSSQLPGAPSQLAVAASSANPSSSLALSWADNANNEGGYRVERSTDGSSFGQIAQVGVNVKSFTDSGLTQATTYYYRVSAFNANGNSAYSNVAFRQTQASSTNTAPTVSIANPSNNASYPNGASITFSASASDTQDGNVTSGMKWNSNLDGQIGTGGSFSRTLSSGTHLITATVTDSGGLVGSSQATLTITSGNTAPTVTISSPANGATYSSGASIAFSGSATDLESGNLTSSLKWSSNLDGQIGTGGSFSGTLSSGIHVITATATDAGGLVGSKQVSLTVSTASPSLSTSAALSVRGYKSKGTQMADLSWSGLSSTSIDVYRNGAIVSTSANDGAETNNINKKGGGSYTYKVCAAGTSTCTNSVSISF